MPGGFSAPGFVVSGGSLLNFVVQSSDETQ